MHKSNLYNIMQIHISDLYSDIHIDTFLYTTVCRSLYHIVFVLVECMYILVLVEQIHTVQGGTHVPEHFPLVLLVVKKSTRYL